LNPSSEGVGGREPIKAISHNLVLKPYHGLDGV